MIYQRFLNKIKKDKNCPFCNFNKTFIIKENRFALLTAARAPYTKDHLLIIPKTHTTKLHKLRKKEKDAIMSLVTVGIDTLHKKYKGVEISYKEGDSLEDAGKSIYHLHFHVVPKKKVVVECDKRNFYSENRLLKEVDKIKKLI